MRLNSSGFTLIEIIIVVILLALSLSLLLGVNYSQRDSFRLKTGSRSLYSFFLAARSYALLENRDNECRYFPESRLIEESLRQKHMSLQDGIVINTNSKDMREDRSVHLVTFFSDGSAGSGSVVMQAGDKAITLHIDPVLGSVRLAAEGS